MKRRLKKLTLGACKSLGLFALARRLTKGNIRVLCYHGSWRTDDGFSGDAMFIRPSTFARHLDLLKKMGIVVIPLDDAVKTLVSGHSAKHLTAAITIDDGWYGTYADMLPELELRQFSATLYCDTAHLEYGSPVPHVFASYLRRVAVGHESDRAHAAFERATDIESTLAARYEALLDYARETGVNLTPYLARRSFSYMTPTELREAAARGLDVQLHTHNHSLHDFSKEQVTREISLNREALGALLGTDTRALTHFCYPSGVTHKDASNHLRSCGVLSATTTRIGLTRLAGDPYDIPRFLDGDHVSDIEFEAQLSGFVDLVVAMLPGWR